MNARRWLSHGIALLLGAAVAAAIAPNSPFKTIMGAGAASTLRSRGTGALPVKVSPRELLAALAGTRMAMARRQKMKLEIYSDWAQRDPLGLLGHLKNRAWPAGGIWHFDRVFIELSHQQPAMLPAYARAYGCQDAMEAVIHGDPRVALAILLAEKPGSFREGLMQDLFEKGERSDPEFYQRIGDVADPAAKAEATAGAAQVMLENRRFADYFRLLDQERDRLDSANIGGSFAHVMLRSQTADDLDRMESMADDVRSAAVKCMLDTVSRDMLTFGGRLEEINGVESLGRLYDVGTGMVPEKFRFDTVRVLLEHGWLDGMEDRASAAITGTDWGLGHNQELAARWKQWAMELPEADNMEMVREAAIARWIKLDPEQVSEIDGLPTQRLRDIAYLAAVASIVEWPLMVMADDVRKLVGKIVDPELRERAAQALEKRIAGKQN